MIFSPEKLLDNESLLNNDETPNKDYVHDFVSAITVNRPYKDLTEVKRAADHLNQVMYTLEQVGLNMANVLEDNEACINGSGDILRACRLVSLRIEQFLDTKTEGGQE